jgi:hypothetical protein
MKIWILLIFLLMNNCDSSTRVDLKNEAIKISLLQLVVTNNIVNNYNGTPGSNGTGGNNTTFFCGLNCLSVGNSYLWHDNSWHSAQCNGAGGIGNSDGLPQPGETGLLSIPLFYSSSAIINDISVTLVPTNPQIQMIKSTNRYPNNTGTRNGWACEAQSSRDNGWNGVPFTQCYYNSCNGYKIAIPSNFSGGLTFKILVYSSMGNTVFDYSL